MAESLLVLKIGGNEIDDPAFLAELGRAVADLPERPVIVHGGGKEIGQLQLSLGLPYQVVSGLRVTTEPVLQVVEMVLSGLVNKRLVATLINAGVPALGLSGVDVGLMRVEKLIHPDGDLGWVGRVAEVNVEAIHSLLSLGLALVISPISLGSDGRTYNVNADSAAAAVAAALGAPALAFVTNVPGVLTGTGVAEQLTSRQVEDLIQAGVIRGGMLPKVRAALEALDQGVAAVKILDLDGLRADRGTRIVGSDG